MKRRLTAMILLILCAMILCSSACSGAAQSREYPEYYEQFATLLGESRETVLKILGLSEEDLELSQNGLYSVPISAKYHGFTFQVTLEFDEINQRLLGFSYVKLWNGAWNDAVRDVGSLSKALTATYGEARNDIDPVRFGNMTADDLKKAFEDAPSHDMQVGTDYWLVKKTESAVMREYIAIIREQNHSLHIAEDPMLTLKMQVSASKAADLVMVQLCFRLDIVGS